MSDEDALTAAVVPTSVLGGVLAVAAHEGVTVDGWFSGTGLSPALVTEPGAKASFRQATTVLRRAVRALPDGPLGLRVGGRDVLMSFGQLGVAMRSCETGADALAVAMELQLAAGGLMDFAAEVDDAVIALTVTERAHEPHLLVFLCEEAFGSVLLLVRTIFGPGVRPLRLRLPYPRPDHHPDYTRVFGCRIEFDADQARMDLPADLLVRPIATRHPAQRAAALAAARTLIDPSDTRPDIVAAVEAILRENLRRPATMAEVAARLHITERTLRRYLDRYDERYSTIRDRVRAQRAQGLLRDTTLPIGLVAGEVGFSDGRELRRAFTRWTGHSPSAERAAARSADAARPADD